MKKPFLSICLLLSAVAFAQTNTFMPDWTKNYSPSEIEGNRPVNSNGQPTGEWQYFLKSSIAYSNETFNYDTYIYKKLAQNKERVIETGKLNSNFLKTGIWKLYHDYIPNKVQFTGAYLDGYKEGVWTEYDYENNIVGTTYYVKGSIDGTVMKVKVYDDFTVKTTSQFKNDIQNGEEIETIVQGNKEYVFSKATYVNFKITGDKINYTVQGDVIAITSHNENGSISEKKEFFENGTLKKLSKPLPDDDGKKMWEHILYYPNGNFKMKYIEKNYRSYYNITSLKDINGADLDFGTLNNGSGTLKSYTDDGKLNSVTTVKKMVNDGPYSEFGTIRFEGIEYPYKTTGQINKDVKEGAYISTIEKDGKTITFQTSTFYQSIPIEQKNYNLNGVLQKEFSIDKSTGKKEEIIYYPSGAIKTKLQFQYPDAMLNVLVSKGPNGEDLDYGTLKNGSGTYKKYDMDGKLENTHTIEDGKIVTKK